MTAVRNLAVLLTTLAWLLVSLAAAAAGRTPLYGSNGMVASSSALASEGGVETLK
jgi:hypothetical protein